MVGSQPLSRLMRGEVLTGPRAADVLVRTPDGRMIVLNMSGAPIRSEAGSVERAVLLARDVTERRRLEKRTSEALEALLAMAEVFVRLPERLQPDEEPPTALEEAQRVGQRVVDLTNSVIESMHVTLLAVDQEEEHVHPVASVGFAPQQEQQWRERLTASPALENHVGSEFLLARLKADMVLMLDGMALPMHTHVLPYYVQAVLCAPAGPL